MKIALPEGVPFPGAMRRNADETATEDATPGLVESAAEHEVKPEVDAATQEKLAAEQDSGADTSGGAPAADESKED